MAGLMSSVETSINANMTDIIHHANSVIVNDIHKLNDDLFDGYQWIAALDNLTCLACAELDNQIRNKISDFPDEPPLHKNCRCIIVPVLQGMKDDPSQTNLNYKDWFDEQDRNTQIDIVGPARFREYQNGKEITSFAKDGQIITLEELGIDRTTRLKVFEEIYKDSAVPLPLTEEQINKLYNDKLTDKELQEAFQKRYTHIEVDLVGKMPRKEMQILFREYDNLLQKYPVGNKLMSIDVEYGMGSKLGKYIPNKSAIVFNRNFVNDNVSAIIKELFDIKHISTKDTAHVYIHEFAHAIDRVKKGDKIGRQLLLEKAHSQYLNKPIEKAWKYFAEQVSDYAMTIPPKTTIPMLGGEFFAEAFTAYFKNKSKLRNEDLRWIIDFFDLVYNNK
jgi:hypothetical protein